MTTATDAPYAAEMPVARGLPLLGNAIPLLRDPLAWLRSAYADHGDIFSVKAGPRRFIVLAGAEANRFVATTGRNSLSSDGFWGAFARYRECPHLLIAMDGPEHMALRKLYKEDLSRKVVDDNRSNVAELTVDLVQRRAAQGGKGVVVVDLVRELVGCQVHSMLTHGAPPVPDEIGEALREVFRWETNTLLLQKWPRLSLYLPQYRRNAARGRDFIEALIQSAESDEIPGWFSSTFEGRRKMPELFSDGDVRAAFLLPFFAGVDTVGVTLGFILYELLRSQPLLDRVRAAVDDLYAAGDGEVPSPLEIGKSPVVSAVVREALRLYPAAFAMYRRAAEDFEFGGYRVPEGEDVVVFTSSTHTDPAYFNDPYTFDIDRFLEPRNEHKQRFVMAPFGGGPHVCLGAGMGEAQLQLSVAVLVRNFDMRILSPTGTLRPFYDPSLSPPRNLVIDIRSRRD